MKDPVLLILIFLFGISFGSFLNVLIYRLPSKQSLIKPPSRCPQCGSRIRFYDNIPIISYILLKGRCRNCQKRISLRYPAVEIVSGLLTVYSIYNFGLSVKGIEVVYLSLVFLAIFFIDLDHTIIPDIFTLSGIVIGLGVSFLPGAIVGWKHSLIGLAVGGGSFMLVGFAGEFIFKKEALGFGDVKYAAMVGTFLGWKNLLVMLLIASFLGSIIGLALIYFKAKKGKPTYIPFGPFLTIGAWISIYFGETLIRAYLSLVGL